MTYVRARNNEQKSERIDHIIEVTLEIFSKTSYYDISLSTIAKKLSFTRANLYKYYKTKEEIFLEIVLRDLRVWVADVENEFYQISSITNIEFASLWSFTLFKHKRLLNLLSILNTIVEQNVTVEKLLPFKKELFLLYESLIFIVNRLLSIPKDKCYKFIEQITMYAVGLYPYTISNCVQDEAIKILNLSYEKPNFVNELTLMVEVILSHYFKDKK